jgi:hypothetical protein
LDVVFHFFEEGACLLRPKVGRIVRPELVAELLEGVAVCDERVGINQEFGDGLERFDGE